MVRVLRIVSESKVVFVMFARVFAAAAVFAALMVVAPQSSEARQCRPGNHMHHGTSDGMPTKADAKRSAIQSWNSFPEFEYGRHWAHFRNARLKKVSCFNRDAGWACAVEGNPCR
ncbi:MAG: hypothetical protein AAFZ01_03150, partial [Pseudomonadota bacterium]